MNTIHQVFISSTFKDLQKERIELTEALLNLDCLPVNMDVFQTATDTQWEWIKKIILQSDYYVLIVKGKYGSINEETKLSYTEMEYDFALANNIPTIAFVVEDVSRLPKDLVETKDKRIAKLEQFKEKIKQNTHAFYATPESLGAIAKKAIADLKQNNKRSGWIKADQK